MDGETRTCLDCGKELPTDVHAAARELYGPYELRLSSLAGSIKQELRRAAAPDSRRSDRELVADAVQDWLGADFECLAAAVRHYENECNA